MANDVDIHTIYQAIAIELPDERGLDSAICVWPLRDLALIGLGGRMIKHRTLYTTNLVWMTQI